MDAINTEGYSQEELRHRIFSNQIPAIIDFDDMLWNTLDALDKRYFNLENDGEDIEALLAGYLDKKAGE